MTKGNEQSFEWRCWFKRLWATLRHSVDQCLLDCYWLVNCLVIFGKTCWTTTNYKLLLSQVKMDMVRLDSVLRKPRGALWNNLRRAIILKFSLHKTEGSLLLRVQIAPDTGADIISVVQEKAVWGEPCSINHGRWAQSLTLYMMRGMPELALLVWRDLVCRFTQASAKSDSFLSTQELWLKEDSRSSLPTGHGKQGWPLDSFSAWSEMGISPCAWPHLFPSTVDYPQRSKGRSSHIQSLRLP